MDFRVGYLVPFDRFLVEATEDYFVERSGMSLDKGERFLESDAAGLFEGEAIDPATDGGKGQRAQVVFAGQPETVSVTGGEEFGFSPRAASPHWTDGVYDVFGGKIMPAGDLCLSRFATAEGAALG